MTLRGKRLSIAIPDTVLEEHDSLRDKTIKVGQMARLCSVFGVDVIQVFRDPRGGGESSVIRRILEYLETPQYLRRRFFPLDETLKYAGLLPPLRIPSHKPMVQVETLRVGDFREGAVSEDGVTVNIGLDRPLLLKHPARASQRVTVRIVSVNPLQGALSDRSQTGQYWGYAVEERSVEQVLSDRRFGLKIATSRMGSPLSGCIERLRDRLRGTGSVLLLFGSPSRGLFEMVKNLRERMNFVINLYDEQHVVTVRTEEAISSALYLLQVLSVLRDKVPPS